MAEIIETTADHGKIDLTPIIKPIIECLKADSSDLLRERSGKIYAVTYRVIPKILNDKKLMKELCQEGGLFSNTEYARVITTLAKNQNLRETQMKQITCLEDKIYEALCALLKGKEKIFFRQKATAYFNAINRLTHKKADTDTPQSSIFPDAKLLKTYPGTKALLRIPQHTIQMSNHIPDALVNAVKQAVRITLEDELPEDEIEDTIDRIDKNLSNHMGRLSALLNILDKNIYGRIRRTYACCVLRRMAEQVPGNSPIIPYVRRVDAFNELVQGTLPESGLAPSDLILEFPDPDGAGVIQMDLMTEFSRADAFDILPFWITFDELLSEVAFKETVTSTMGQHFKMNGKVQNQGGGAVFEFNLNKIEMMAKAIKARQGSEVVGSSLRLESTARVLRIAVLYYVIFRDDPKQYRNALTNFKALKMALAKWNKEKKGLDDILTQIAESLKNKEIIRKNHQMKNDFKSLLTSRKLDSDSDAREPCMPLKKQRLYLILSRENILSDTEGMENADPIKPPPSKDFTTGYLRFLKVTRHPDRDYNALFKEEISITEQMRYLTVPENNALFCERKMLRDKNRNIIGVLFLPEKMLRLSLAFDEMTNLIISYDRDQLHGIAGDGAEVQGSPANGKETLHAENKPDAYLAGMAQLIHILLVYGVLKAVARMTNELQDDLALQGQGDLVLHGDKPMLMMLSLYGTASHTRTEQPSPFTHDAHKAIVHIIRQHMPVKSQGFKLNQSGEWDRLIRQQKGTSKDIPGTYLNTELSDYRFWNIVTGLSSGLDALWQLPEEPGIRQIALLSLTSRSCDQLNKRSHGDRDVMFGNIHRFEYEIRENGHFFRHKPVQAFCDDMNTADRFQNPSVLFHTLRQLYEEGFHDVMIITKVPFTRRIRMTAEEDSTYTNPMILQRLNDELPDLRVYPLFTQKSFGIRLFQGKTKYPIFLPHDPANDLSIGASDKSTLFRAASIVTYRIVEGGGSGEKLHSGITDYLFRCYPDTMTIQSKAMALLTTVGKAQAALYEVLRFLHANAYQKSVAPKGGISPLEAKLDPLDTIIGEKSVGEQADVLQFPKMTGKNGKYKFTTNIIALLKHLENQSDQYRLVIKS